MAKKRLDVLLFEKGLCPSRERAKTAIMEGIVYIAGQKAGKAGDMVDENAELEVRGNDNAFVSRGGKKIEKALNYFAIDPSGLTVMDVGASTGGFTDGEGLLHRRRLRSARMEPASGPARQVHGAHQYPLCNAGYARGDPVALRHRRIVHLAEARAASRCGPADRGRPRGQPHQAAV